MDISDMAFFHQATMRICGSLDIDEVLCDCLSFFKSYIPINGIILSIIEDRTNIVKMVASNIEAGSAVPGLKAPIKLDSAAMAYIAEHIDEPVQIVHDAPNDPACRQASQVMGHPVASYMVLKLISGGKLVGTVLILADGACRYNDEHARLLGLLHDPFTIAMSNTLKHQELNRIKDRLADDNRYLNGELRKMVGDRIIGQNEGLKNVMEMARQVAPLTSPVLIQGETGVGKELIANTIHYSSPRAKGPLIKVNCGAIPESLIDSELFGHEKGAFTGATFTQRGRFERADKGTIFLDEIGELPLQAQVRLLRVIQNREIERVGGSRVISLDIRIIAATHRNMEDMVKKGQFREDLWFRLNVFPINIPPLRHRKMDIPALVNYFINRKSNEMNLAPISSPCPKTMHALQNYHWPGNVRELENVVERTLIRDVASFGGKWLQCEESAIDAAKTTQDKASPIASQNLNLDDVMKQHIEYVLKLTQGRVHGKNGAAALLGVNANTLRHRMDKLGVAYGKDAKKANTSQVASH